MDILVTGHTHEANHFTADGVLYLNPGSITGAPTVCASTDVVQVLQSVAEATAAGGGGGARDESLVVRGAKLTPSFMLCAVQGDKVVVYIYKELDGQLHVDQFEHAKEPTA